MVVYIEERLDEKSLYISKENYKLRKERYWERTEAMLNYASSLEICRSQQLLQYFGESGSEACGVCDACKRRKEKELQQEEFDLIRDEVKGILALEPVRPDDLLNRVAFSREKVIQVIQWLLDNNLAAYTEDQKLMLTKNK